MGWIWRSVFVLGVLGRVSFAADTIPIFTGTPIPFCVGANKALQYDDTVHAWGCATMSGGGTTDAAADGMTKGVVTFAPADFDCTTGLCSLDYANAQKASATVPGLLTAADWTLFTGKQPALGFTPENTANKTTSVGLGTSDALYPSQNAVKSYVDTGLATKQATLGFAAVPDTRTVAGHPLTSNVTLVPSDAGLGSVTNDTQLKRSGNDYSGFATKTTPAAGDVLLIEDSAASGVKKQITLGSLPASGNGTPGGATSQTQYNNTGAFAGSTGLMLDATTILARKDHVTPLNTNTTMGVHNVLTCTAGATDKTFTLPAASSTTLGQVYRLIKVDSGIGACLFAPAAGERINGIVNGTKSALTQYAQVEVILTDTAVPNWSAFSALTSVPQTIASGTLALSTTAIASGACTTAQTATAAGVITTDVVSMSFNGDPTAITGFVPNINGMLTIVPYPAANAVSVKVCNMSSASITPGALTLNWRVSR